MSTHSLFTFLFFEVVFNRIIYSDLVFFRYNRHSHLHVTENEPKFSKLISELTEEDDHPPIGADENSIGGDPTQETTSTDDGNDSEPMQMIEADDFLI